MATDYRFIQYVNDQILLNSIHYIRKMGNVAVHEGVLSVDEALKVLEELHFLVGEICILMQVAPDYPEFEKPTVQSAPLRLLCLRQRLRFRQSRWKSHRNCARFMPRNCAIPFSM